MYNKNLSFHFVGIGGSGMSGIAEILLRRGFHVTGSDLKESRVTRQLNASGAEIFIGHNKENIGARTSLLVTSSAVGEENVEVREARRLGIPVVRRAEVLAELLRLKFGIAVAGSHGKTTTTSLTAWILERSELDPTIIIGGIVHSIGSGGKDGDGQFLVAESDESDRSFLLLKPTISVVTNIDNEHLRAYTSEEDLRDSFMQFAGSVPFYGLAVYCLDDPTSREVCERLSCRKCSYGFHEEAAVRAVDMRTSEDGSRFILVVRGKVLGTIELPLYGRHNCQNALAAIAVSLEIGLSFSQIQEALKCFPGVKRRMELLAEDKNYQLISDYAHHPSEIAQTLTALRARFDELHVVFQPHRFSRLRDCYAGFLECFTNADTLTVTDVYTAGEMVIEGMNSELLVKDLSEKYSPWITQLSKSDPSVSQPIVRYEPSCSKAIELIAQHLQTLGSNKRKALICLGAGSIGLEAEIHGEKIATTEASHLPVTGT